MTTNIHEYAPWHKDRFYVYEPYKGAGSVATRSEKSWLGDQDYPVLTADELRRLPIGAVVVRNCPGSERHLSEVLVSHKNFPLVGGLYALKSLPATQPDSGYIALIDEDGLVEESVVQASSKPWLDGVTLWQLLEIHQQSGFDYYRIDKLLQGAYEYLQKARGEA